MAVKPTYAVGLDAGSRQTRIVIGIVEEQRLRFLGCGAVPSQGWSPKGTITDQRAVSASILAALHQAESAAGVSVESAVVGMGGPTTRGSNGRGRLDFQIVREITQHDVNRVVDRASNVQLQEDRMVLQLYPQDFVVDGHPGHRDPRGMMGSQLEINVHLVTCSIQEHTNLIGAVNLAHLLVEETVFEPLAACFAAVIPEDRRQGVALLDIGAHSTELVVYAGEAMLLASTLPICGDHYTKDIAQGLVLTYDEAELVKCEFGSASSQACCPNSVVELPTPTGRERRHAKWQIVNSILEARAREMFRFVRAELARVGMDRSLMGGVFLAGGGARLPDLCDIAENELQCQTRFGLAIGIQDWPDYLNDSEWTTAAGLAMYSAKLKQAEQTRHAGGWFNRILR